MAKNSIADIAAVVARKQKISKKEAADIVTTFFKIISEGLREDKQVKVRGLGTFKIIPVKARESVNVNTGERLIIEGHDKVTFVPDASMKELVNKPFAQFVTVPVNEGVNFDSIDAASAAEERKTRVEPESEQSSDSVEQDEEAEDQENDVESSDELAEASTEQTEDTPSPINDTPSPTNDTPSPEENTPSNEGSKEIISFDEPSTDSLSTSGIIFENKQDTESQLNEEIKSSEEQRKTSEEEVSDKSVDTPLEPLNVHEESAEKKKVSNELHEDSNVDEETTDSSEGNVSREYFDEQMSVCRRRCNRNLVLSIVLLVVGLVAGFLLGQYFKVGNKEDKTVAKVQPVIKTQPVDTVDSVVKDSVKDTIPTQAPVAAVEKPSKDTIKVAKEEKAEKEEKKSDDDIKDKSIAKLNSDRRLRFGAYEIVGIDKVIKLKKGQTMHSYSNKTLGKDMVVYFQVLNGVDEMKPGDELKVPKIRLKKQYRK